VQLELLLAAQAGLDLRDQAQPRLGDRVTAREAPAALPPVDPLDRVDQMLHAVGEPRPGGERHLAEPVDLDDVDVVESRGRGRGDLHALGGLTLDFPQLAHGVAKHLFESRPEVGNHA
jgi:hypothetical protein